MAEPLCGGVTPTSNQVNTCAKFEEISQDNVEHILHFLSGFATVSSLLASVKLSLKSNTVWHFANKLIQCENATREQVWILEHTKTVNL